MVNFMRQLGSEKKYIDKILKFGEKLPEEIINVSPGLLISLMRKRLRMSQKYLAKKIGVSQPYIARFESGKLIPSLTMLEKIFKVMDCSFSIILVPQKMPDEILKGQAKKIAQKRMKYIKGTMSLESQMPNQEEMKELLMEEQNKILLSKTEKIWDIEDEK